MPCQASKLCHGTALKGASRSKVEKLVFQGLLLSSAAHRLDPFSLRWLTGLYCRPLQVGHVHFHDPSHLGAADLAVKRVEDE